MKSVPPRGSGWVHSQRVSYRNATHPLPRGGTDLITPAMLVFVRVFRGSSDAHTIRTLKRHLGHLLTLPNIRQWSYTWH